MKFLFFQQGFLKTFKYHFFMKILQVGAKLIHVDWQMYTCDTVSATLHNFDNTP
jgi:hypothetical protein